MGGGLMEKIFEKLGRYFGEWKIGILNPNGGMWDVSPTREAINYLKAQNATGHHIFIKPISEEPFLLVDDISPEGLLAHKISGTWRPGRLIVETSPANFQIWIKSNRPLTLSEKRFWLKRFHSDPGCDPNSRWGRCPGFRNRKEKYEVGGKYPLSKLIWIDFKKEVLVPIVELPKEPLSRTWTRKVKPPLKGSLKRSDYERGDASATDFAYALALLRYGFTEEDIAERIICERDNWDNHKGDRRKLTYIKRTINRAKNVIIDTNL
jgi:hypothetical protein